MKTIRVRILASLAGPGYSYGKGFEGDVPEELAKDLIRAGHATQLNSKAEQREKAIPNTDKKEKR